MTLDMAAWAALLGLIDEVPVLLANVRARGAPRPRSVSPSAFEFVPENTQVASVRAFMDSVPGLLAS